MGGKVAQFWEEVIRLKQEEAAAKVLKKAHDDNRHVIQHTSHELSWSSAACADLVASSDIIITCKGLF